MKFVSLKQEMNRFVSDASQGARGTVRREFKMNWNSQFLNSRRILRIFDRDSSSQRHRSVSCKLLLPQQEVEVRGTGVGFQVNMLRGPYRHQTGTKTALEKWHTYRYTGLQL